MHNKSKSHHHPHSPHKIEESKKYIDFIDYRKKNLISMNIENEQQPNLCLNQLNKISPLIYNRNVNKICINDKQDRSFIGLSMKKQEIKEKIKDRIKAQIQNLIKRNTFTHIQIKKVQTSRHAKETLQGENVSVIGASVSSPFARHTPQKQLRKLKNIRKSIIFSQLAFSSRKAKSSLDSRPITGELETNDERNEKLCCIPLYRRSQSTDIRVKNIKKRKASQVQRKLQKNNDESLQPWVISSFVDEPQNF